VSETWFTLQNDITAHETGIKITDKASLTLDGFTAGGNSSLKQEWKDKAGLEVSEEDTFHIAVGTPDKVGILLDLRPASELMSPIFVPHDPDDAWGRFAPWVWTAIRSDFEGWLTKQGLDQPVAPDLVADYTPRRFDIAVTSVHIDGQFPAVAHQTPSGILKATGSVQLNPVPLPKPTDPPATDPIDPSQSLLYGARPASFSGATVHPSALATTAACSIATTAGNLAAGPNGGLCLMLAFNLDVKEDVMSYAPPGPRGGGGAWYDVTWDRVHFQNSGMRVDLPFAAVPKGQAQTITKTVTASAGYYTLEITIVAKDAGNAV
jgi:hypothetical protein